MGLFSPPSPQRSLRTHAELFRPGSRVGKKLLVQVPLVLLFKAKRPEIQTQVSPHHQRRRGVSSRCFFPERNYVNSMNPRLWGALLRRFVSPVSSESHQPLSSASWCLFQHSDYLSVTIQSGKATHGRGHHANARPAERLEPGVFIRNL